MKRILVFALVLSSPMAFAVKGKGKSMPTTYVVKGQTVSATQAVLELARGGTAMKCQEVDLKEMKTGISLKAKKAD